MENGMLRMQELAESPEDIITDEHASLRHYSVTVTLMHVQGGEGASRLSASTLHGTRARAAVNGRLR